MSELSLGRCYACFRPLDVCFCAAIPRIENRTHVLILQHRREQFHPFNTARIVQKALRNSQLVADYTVNLADRLQLHPRAGVLYPCPSARLISDVPPEQRPAQLVVLDGTWPQAQTLIRKIPALRDLPRYCLAPAEPSRYRIRREPTAMSLSTVEAAVAALRVLEPETAGFDLLLQAFDRMVEDQLAHPGSAEAERRHRARQQRTYKNVPRPLLGNVGNLVVAYGETPAGGRGAKKVDGPPTVWVARRLGTGETFSCLLNPPHPVDDVYLGHLSLTRADLAAAVSLEEARRRWAQFQRPDDIVTVRRPSTARLYKYLATGRPACLVLKSVDCDLTAEPLADAAAAAFTAGGPALGASASATSSAEPDTYAGSVPHTSRAHQRLAEAVAIVQHLHALAIARLGQAASPQPLAPWRGYTDEWASLRPALQNAAPCDQNSACPINDEVEI